MFNSWGQLSDAAHGDNSGGPISSTGPVVRSPADYAACQAYILKYRAHFGRDPFVDCGPPPGVIGPPAVTQHTDPVIITDPPVTVPYQPPLSPGPVYRHRTHRRPPSRPRRPYVEPHPYYVAPRGGGELCPIAGYVSRDIAGAGEYQIFRCTPGQPVVIDPGLQAVGRREALARHGLAGLDDITVGNINVPVWAIAVAVGAGLFLFMKRR